MTRTIALACAALLAVSLIPSTLGQDVIQPVNAPCAPPGENEIWRIENQIITCENRTIKVLSLDVTLGSIVTFRNVELVINAEFDSTASTGRFLGASGDGIGPYQTTRLTIIDSNIHTANPAYRATGSFLSDTIVHISGSAFRDFRVVGGTVPKELRYTGNTFLGLMYLGATDNTWILDNLFIGGQHGVRVQAAAPEAIDGNTIVGCSMSGIVFIGAGASSKSIQGNTVVGCSTGIVGAESCVPRKANFNDVLLTEQAKIAICGDATNNYWGPDASDVDTGPWSPTTEPRLTEPAHPDRLPRAIMAPTPSSVQRGVSVPFDASSSLPSTQFGFPLATYTWTFGDGNEATGPTATHSYSATGTYKVRLTLEDETGLARILQREIQVTTPSSSTSSSASTSSSSSSSTSSSSSSSSSTASSSSSSPSSSTGSSTTSSSTTSSSGSTSSASSSSASSTSSSSSSTSTASSSPSTTGSGGGSVGGAGSGGSSGDGSGGGPSSGSGTDASAGSGSDTSGADSGSNGSGWQTTSTSTTSPGAAIPNGGEAGSAEGDGQNPGATDAPGKPFGGAPSPQNARQAEAALPWWKRPLDVPSERLVLALVAGFAGVLLVAALVLLVRRPPQRMPAKSGPTVPGSGNK